MQRLKEKINSFFREKSLNKKQIITIFIVSILVFLFFYIRLNQTPLILWIVGVLSALGIISGMLLAGKIFMKAIIIAGTGFSLILFIGQSYCDLPISLQTSNNSLKIIITISSIYLIVLFLNEIYKDLTNTIKVLENVKPKKFEILITIIGTAFFISLFSLSLFQIIEPIISNLCVYQ